MSRWRPNSTAYPAVRMIAFEVVETDSLKVLIVDDHPMVREGLAGIFARHNISAGMVIRTEKGSLSETFFGK